MTELQGYLAFEIAIDHADGLLTRREALRRLALLGLGIAAASSMLAACAETKNAPPAGASGTGGTSAPSAPTAPTASGPEGG